MYRVGQRVWLSRVEDNGSKHDWYGKTGTIVHIHRNSSHEKNNNYVVVDPEWRDHLFEGQLPIGSRWHKTQDFFFIAWDDYISPCLDVPQFTSVSDADAWLDAQGGPT